MKTEIVKKLESFIDKSRKVNDMNGFEKAFALADAFKELNSALTTDLVKPIYELQGSKLGFRTDKDSGQGYTVEVVKRCLIEAVLTGVQPVNNQFNIIAGNCYITKEGFGYLLKNYSGLKWEIIPMLPRINEEKKSAAITMQIKWSINGGEENERNIDFPIKLNNFMGTDAVIGKATRKARAWLYNNITDNEIADGDVQDVNAQDVTYQGAIKEPKIDVSQATAKKLFDDGAEK